MRMAHTPKLEVHVWSDVACPWCWVGKKRLDKAIARVADRAKVESKFHAYMIDPATKKGGEEYMAYNKRRWGSDSWTADLRASGKPDGAEFANWKSWPNTLKAHGLVALAEQNGVPSSAAKEALFKATYEEGANVSNSADLQQIAKTLGIPDAAEKLQSGELDDLVLQEDRHAKQEMDIHGVPYFLICSGQNKTVLQGAQSVQAFEHALNSHIARGAAGNA